MVVPFCILKKILQSPLGTSGCTEKFEEKSKNHPYGHYPVLFDDILV